MFKVAIFDLDGTLLNTIEDLANACNYALSKFSFPTHTLEKYKRFVGNGLYKLVERALPIEHKDKDTVNMVLDVFNKYYNEHMMDVTKPYDGIIELLDELILNGVKLAVVSNKKHDFTLEIVNKYFGSRFNIVFGQRENYKAKPDPVTVLEVIDNFNITKDECIYIGDSDIDIITAKNAKVTSVGVTWGFRSEEELIREGADYIVHNTYELRNKINQI